jgi:hypothetical protein
MSTNQQIILQTLVEQKHAELAPAKSINDFFHLFATEQILKDYDLNYDEINRGVTEGGGDGGIDGIYTFLNGELIQDANSILDSKKNALLELIIIQSKFSPGFTEEAINKCISSAKDLLDLSKDIDSLRTVYNVNIISNMSLFREQYKKIISKFPKLEISYFYCTKGTTVHPNVERKIHDFRREMNKLFSDATLGFTFITAGDLLEISRKERTTSKGLVLKDNPISTQDGGYIAISGLKSYYEFITKEDKLLKYFFDANIRDYQGGVEVNKGINETLQNKHTEEDFWWLNNGITITASTASYSGKTLTIEDPQIVNGLQTSFEIYNYFTTTRDFDDERSILVRVITTKSEKSRLKVIRATNSQTKVPLSSLRATEEIHRDIEDYFTTKGLFYDRRKNFYKNEGKPWDKIISIAYLGQAIMAIVLQEPDYARARPSSLLKDDCDYSRVFNSNYPIDLYLKCILILKLVEDTLKNSTYNFSTTQIGDIKFHVTLYLVCRITKKAKPSHEEIVSINVDAIPKDDINTSIDDVFVLYDSLGGTNAVAKGKEMINELKKLISENAVK